VLPGWQNKNRREREEILLPDTAGPVTFDLGQHGRANVKDAA
jgi:hypothetical protein